MMSSKRTALLLVAIMGGSFADPLPDRRSYPSPNSESRYNQNSANTASQYGINPGYYNPVGANQQNDRQSYPYESTSTRSSYNPAYQRSENTGRYSGYENSAGNNQQNDKPSYPQDPTPTRLPYNRSYNSLNTAPQYEQRTGYPTPTGIKPQNDRKSYPPAIPTGPPFNLTFMEPLPEIKPYTESPNVENVYDQISGQLPTNSKQRNFYGSVTVQKDNVYELDPNTTNYFGSITHLSGAFVTPQEQKILDDVGKQSFSLDSSEPKTLQIRDDKLVNRFGAISHQTNTAYTPQSQQSTKQSTGSRQTTSTQNPNQESFEAQQLKYLMQKVADLSTEIQHQEAEIKAMQTSLNSVDQYAININSMVYELLTIARAKRN